MMVVDTGRLRALFARRDLLAGQLAEVDRRIAASTAAYCDSKGYRIRLRPEAVRKEIER